MKRKTRVADALAPLMNAVLAPETRVRFEFWDGSALGPLDSPGVVTLRSAEAIRHILWAPGELGLALVPMSRVLSMSRVISMRPSAFSRIRCKTQGSASRRCRSVAGAIKLGLFGGPPRRPSEEARQRGRLRSRSRDSEAVSHHYDVGNDFYRTVLGPSMTYSCARFVDDKATLEMAQAAKHDLICRKLGLGDRSKMSCSTSAVDGVQWPYMRRPDMASRSWASRSARNRRRWHAGASTKRG